MRRHVQLAILCVAVFLSGTAVHGQTQEEFIAGCAVGAFDSFSALKANCPPRTKEQVVDVRPAFTPQQLDEMNKYARDGVAALQQYLNKQSISTVHPPVTRIDTTPSNTPKNQASDEVPLYQPSTLPSTPPSGGALTGIAKALGQNRENARSRALANAQRELYEAEREMADSHAFFQREQALFDAFKAGIEAIQIARSAGVPILADGISYKEATALVKKQHLNPNQTHIFPCNILYEFNASGTDFKMKFGMPVSYLVFAVVGDAPESQQQP